jgi:N4-(beta-N-acetylglucosaminyl)-L-asparaginase
MVNVKKIHRTRMKSFDRRTFVKKSLTLSALSLGANTARAEQQVRIPLPAMICSRGHKWGERVLQPAWQKWLTSQNMLDAVETGANVVEQDPDDNSVGYGGLPNEEGKVTLDASIMKGPGHRCGSVAALENIVHASSVARLVMERTDHIMLVGKDAYRFARAHGFKKENLLTEKSRIEWLRWKETLSERDDWLPADHDTSRDNERITGTINVLGIDDQGNVFGMTTTSGLAYKIPGRVGDSPIIGAGLYLDNAVGAAGATGRGEEVIRTCGSFLIVEKMRDGMSPQQACEYALKRIAQVNTDIDFNVKYIAINKKGQIGCTQFKPIKEPICSAISVNGIQLITGKHVKS